MKFPLSIGVHGLQPPLPVPCSLFIDLLIYLLISYMFCSSHCQAILGDLQHRKSIILKKNNERQFDFPFFFPLFENISLLINELKKLLEWKGKCFQRRKKQRKRESSCLLENAFLGAPFAEWPRFSIKGSKHEATLEHSAIRNVC